jgi:hypothetical protein
MCGPQGYCCCLTLHSHGMYLGSLLFTALLSAHGLPAMLTHTVIRC